MPIGWSLRDGKSSEGWDDFVPGNDNGRLTGCPLVAKGHAGDGLKECSPWRGELSIVFIHPVRDNEMNGRVTHSHAESQVLFLVGFEK